MLSTEIQPQRASRASLDTPQNGLFDGFLAPPTSYRPVPFYWWAGGRLERDRLAWQLDRLKEGGVYQMIVSYPHLPDGTTDLGDPVLFSQEWWTLFKWFLGACKARGMKVGFQDYTIIEPLLSRIGMGTDGMEGGRLTCVSGRVREGESLVLHADPAWRVIGARAYPVHEEGATMDGSLDLGDAVSGGSLEWKALQGEWLVVWVLAEISNFDPMHPEAGKGVIRDLYQPFERECGEDFGDTLNLFFQDELDFGSRMPFWSGVLLEAFRSRFGYDPVPWLAVLWHDLGPASEKFRMEYADLVVELVERNYFQPVFEWHDKRGILFGHDNSGRGGIATGRSFYGDYFRTMRWFSAPGCDDPKIHGPRAFKGLKMNASIAHFNHRPRVWVEAFHSSGWGTTPEEVVGALNEDFAYGATVVNLHGLYYTTQGGWWEWAPPDFHFRQPYWQHFARLNDYMTRLCWLLSQGVHRCDVAIVYPIASLHAQAADPARDGVIAHMGNEDFSTGEPLHPSAEQAAFGLGKHLFDHACDFDFIDDASLAASECEKGTLRAVAGRYRVMILPAMDAVRHSTLEAALRLVESGGMVLAFGRLPKVSDLGGRSHPATLGLLDEIFGSHDESRDLRKYHGDRGVACYVARGYDQVLQLIRHHIESDVVSDIPLQVLHRQVGSRDVYYLFNPSPLAVSAEISFRRKGAASWWDAWTGARTQACVRNGMKVEFDGRQARVLVFDDASGAVDAPRASVAGNKRVESLDGLWDFQVVPTLDNRHGDFELPVKDTMIGPQARKFRYCEEHETGLTEWADCTYSFGARMESIGPFPPGEDFAAMERNLLDDGNRFNWSPYEFSTQLGIERDPFLTDWLSGPHGLKGVVPDDFIDFHSETPGSVWYLRAQVVVEQSGRYAFLAGGRCAYEIWINGSRIASQSEALAPGVHAPWSIPHYESEPIRTEVDLAAGVNSILVKLVQPHGQRTRAYFAFNPPDTSLGIPMLKWFARPGTPVPSVPAPSGRKALRFRFPAPPGAQSMEFVSQGPARVWVAGHEMEVGVKRVDADGWHHCRVGIRPACGISAEVEVRIEAPLDVRGGAAWAEPVRFDCGPGKAPAGDWRDLGLATFSGMATYTRTLEIAGRDEQVTLDLGKVSATAEVRVNGRVAATLVASPWKCDITPFLNQGSNELSVTVANTLANQYSVGIPSPYAFDHQTLSGLIGPVTLIHD